MTWEFTDLYTGEDFFVEADTIEKAMDIANEYFEEPKCYGTVPEEYAEMMGYDTY